MSAFVIYDAGGTVLRAGTCPDALLPFQARASLGEQLLTGVADPFLHYVANGVVCAYTAAELAVKNSLPPGVVWKMPERVAVDTRSTSDKAAQAALDADINRARAYPPLAILADALYWQANGDSKPMAAYMANVAAVKVKFPKPKGA